MLSRTSSHASVGSSKSATGSKKVLDANSTPNPSIVLPRVPFDPDSRASSPHPQSVALKANSTDFFDDSLIDSRVMGDSIGIDYETKSAVRDKLDAMIQLQDVFEANKPLSVDRKSSSEAARELKELKRFLRERNYVGVDPSVVPVHYASGSLVAMIDPGNLGTIAARTVTFDKMIPHMPGTENESRRGRFWASSEDTPDMATQDEIQRKKYNDKLRQDELEKIAEQQAHEAAMRPATPATEDEHENELLEHLQSQFSEEELAAAAEYTGETMEELRNNRKKTAGLQDYVNAHTSRKIIDEWNHISGKFEASAERITIKDQHTGNIRYVKAIYLSDLVLLLCSSKVKIKASELTSMCVGFKCSVDMINRARKMAAVKLIIQIMTVAPNANKSEKRKYELELQFMQREEEILVSVEQMIDFAFSKNAEKRSAQWEKIEALKPILLQQHIDEKEKRRAANEKAEIRVIKAKQDFDNMFKELQYAKGTLSINRLYCLKGVVEHCRAVVKEANAESMIAVPIDVLDLIGKDVFAQSIIDTSVVQNEQKALNSAIVRSKQPEIEKPSNLLNGEFRVHLQSNPPDSPGSPSFVFCLRETVVNAKGLNGFSTRDVLEFLQSYSSTRLQATVRGYMKRKQYKAVRALQMKIYGIIKIDNFKAWAQLTRRNVDQRMFLWRKIKAWKIYTDKVNRLKSFFRQCFWPFYVWRRWSQANKTAKEKVLFLVSRVLPTYVQIKVFNAWNKYTAKQGERKRIGDNQYDRTMRIKSIRLLLHWHRWAEHRHNVRRVWLMGGLVKLKKAEEFRKIFPFMVWKAYVYYKRLVRSRVKELAHVFREKVFKDGKHVRIRPSKASLRNEELRKGILGADPDAPRLIEESTIEDKSDNESDDGVYFDEIWPSPDEKYKTKEGIIKRVGVPRELKHYLKCEIESDKETIYRKDEHLTSLSKQARVVEKHQDKLALNTLNNEMDISSGPRKPVKSKEPKDKAVIYETVIVKNDPFTNRMDKLYDDHFNSHPKIVHLGFLEGQEQYIYDKVAVIAARAKETEKGILFERSMCYHRNAHRVFNNLKVYWLVTRNARYSKDLYNLRLMKVCFDAIYRWMNRGAGNESDELLANMTSGEKLVTELRKIRIDKMVKRKKIITKLKELDDDTADLDEMGNKIISTTKNTKGENKKSELEPDKSAKKQFNPLGENFSDMSDKNVIQGNETDEKDGSSVGDGDSASVDVGSITSDSSSVKVENTNISTQPTDKNKTKNTVSTGSSKSKPKGKVGKKGRKTKLMKEEKTEVETFELPESILEVDREDRKIDSEHIGRMLQLSTDFTVEVDDLVEKAQIISKKYARIKQLSSRYLSEIQAAEEAVTQTAIEHELEYAEEFKIWAADAMLELLVKVNRDVQMMLSKAVLKKCFRYLRLPIMDKIGKVMMNRMQIKNWIRIGTRFQSIGKRLPYYRRMRTMWILFNRWLKYLEKETLNTTVGLSASIKRRAELASGFHRELDSYDFKPMIYYNSRRLLLQSCCLSMTFYRWRMDTQEEIVFRNLESKVADAYKAKAVARCFISWRTLRTAGEVIDIHKANLPFSEVKIKTDIDQYVKRFTSKRKRAMPYIIKRLSAQFTKKQIQNARNSLSYKKFVHTFKIETNARLVSEQRILVDGFGDRGRLDFVDLYGPADTDDPIVPASMSRFEGDHFADPAIAYHGHRTGISEIPGGYKLTKMRINSQVGLGIVGWQLCWSAEGAKEKESPKRGKWSGAGFSTEDIVIGIDDFVMGMEYYYEGPVMYGIRLKRHFAGWSQWVGGKSSPSTLICSIDISNSEKTHFEEMYEKNNGPEDPKTGFPRAYVIGFAGVESVSRGTCPRLVVRKVINQHIFSYHWVQEGIDNFKKELEQELNETKAAEDALEKKMLEAKRRALHKKRGIHVPSDDDDHSMISQGSGGTKDTQKSAGTHTLPSITSKSQDYKSQRQRAHEEHEKKLQAHDKKKMGKKSNIHNISDSEEQFFDCIRMRLTEVREAESRAFRLSRLLWTSNVFRQEGHPMGPLTNIAIIRGLCVWYFNSINKKLVPVPKTEKQAFELIEKSKGIKLKSEIQFRRGMGLQSMVKQANAAPHSWDSKPILGPADREAKRIFTTRVAKMEVEAQGFLKQADDMMFESSEMFKKGRALMPTLDLSYAVCQNYRRKLAASQQKMSLLTVMDLNQLKQALQGSSARDFSLSNNVLDLIIDKVSNRKEEVPPIPLKDAISGVLVADEEKKRQDDTFLCGDKTVALNSSFLFRKNVAVDAPRIFIKKRGKQEALPIGKRSALLNQSRKASQFQDVAIESRLEEHSFDLSERYIDHYEDNTMHTSFETFEDIINEEKMKVEVAN